MADYKSMKNVGQLVELQIRGLRFRPVCDATVNSFKEDDLGLSVVLILSESNDWPVDKLTKC